MKHDDINEIRKEAFDNLRKLNCDRPSVLEELDRLERSASPSTPKWPWVIIAIAVLWAVSLLILGI